MELANRIAIYREIEAYRKTPLIVYVTSTRGGAGGQMAGDVVREFIDQIDVIPEENAGVDILIHSTGGDALAAWKLMSILRERFQRIAVLVPNSAFSAATLFALGADEIVMHPHASLGPIDPQIHVQGPGGEILSFSFEQIGAFLRFLGEEVGVSEQEYKSGLAEKLLTTVNPLVVGGAKRASELAADVGERLLRMHMTDAADQQRAREIAENLNKTFFDHSDAVSRKRAEKLQLKIADSDPDLESLIWSAFEGIEAYMQLREPFIPLTEYLRYSDEAAATIAPPAPVSLPPNAPAEVVRQIWSQAATTALQNASEGAIEAPYEVVNAILESSRAVSAFCTKGSLSASRMLSGEVQVATLEKEKGWSAVSLPDAREEQ